MQFVQVIIRLSCDRQTKLSQVNLTMNQFLSSISPPTDPDLCDARLVAMSLALDNLVLVTSSILTGCQWLQVCLAYLYSTKLTHATCFS